MEKEKFTSIKNVFEFIKHLINPTNYYREVRKKVNIHFIIIISVSILLFYYLFKDFILNNILTYFNNRYDLLLHFELLKNVPNTLYIILVIYYFYFYIKFISSKRINILDKFFIYAIIFSLLSLLVIRTNNKVFLFFILIVFILLIIRFLLYNIVNLKPSNPNFTLEDFYTGKFDSDLLKNVLIKDSDKIKYDLFGRKPIIINLCNSIIMSKINNDCFTIGVIGEWGSGKSTIINFAKQELKDTKDFIIIDDFDPWTINSEDALILAMYNTIIENLGENISYFKRKKVQNALLNVTTDIPYIGKGLGNFFKSRIDDYSEYKEIKADLEEKLKKSKKRLVFIIDNLDRMSKKNLLFLLTLTGTLFKLPNITYIVAYDKERLNKILDPNEINPKYIEKLINKEILIPKIHNSDKQYIFYNCLKNFLKENDEIFSIKINQIVDEINNTVFMKIASKFYNIRDFIRFINFISYDINYSFLVVYLDRNDFLIMKTIQFLDYELYQKIYKNKDFITKIIKEEKDLTEKDKQFYEEVESSDFFDLLQLLSHNHSNFKIVKNLKENSIFYDDNIDFKNRNYICNSFSFDNYFTFNNYTKYYIEIKNFFILNSISYENTTLFFDENKKYLNDPYMAFLLIYISELKKIKSTNEILLSKLFLIIYFLKLIINKLFNEYKLNLEKTYSFELKKSAREIDNNIYNELSEVFQEYYERIRELFISVLNSKEFFSLKQFSIKFNDINNFNYFCNKLETNREDNNKIIDNCIEIASNTHITQREQIEKLLKELEVLFKNNIK